jgi:hypothetical protein
LMDRGIVGERDRKTDGLRDTANEG